MEPCGQGWTSRRPTLTTLLPIFKPVSGQMALAEGRETVDMRFSGRWES